VALAAFCLPLLRCGCHETDGAPLPAAVASGSPCSNKRRWGPYSIPVAEVKEEGVDPIPGAGNAGGDRWVGRTALAGDCYAVVVAAWADKRRCRGTPGGGGRGLRCDKQRPGSSASKSSGGQGREGSWEARPADREAPAERGEAVGLLVIVSVRRVGSSWQRLAPGRHPADKHRDAEKARVRVVEVALSAWAEVVGTAIGGWDHLAELADEGVSVTPVRGAPAPAQGRVGDRPGGVGGMRPCSGRMQGCRGI
jgi:hypothetical protein